MQHETWPELSDWELNSWALLTAPDPDSPMGHPNFSSQTQTFPQATNFYDTSLVSTNFHQTDINSLLNASTTSRSSTQQSLLPTAPIPPPPQSQSKGKSKASPTHATPSSSSSPSSPQSSKVHKRTLNTLAARRYRQKRLDQMADLEQKLRESEKEKEELQMRVARLEGEVEVLRGLLRP